MCPWCSPLAASASQAASPPPGPACCVVLDDSDWLQVFAHPYADSSPVLRALAWLAVSTARQDCKRSFTFGLDKHVADSR